jgi:Sulfotransferase domain
VTRLPDTFIIGAPKSGTTSLYEWLRGHPEVFMTAVKEPCYFSRDLAADKSGNFLRYGADRERYLALFGGAATAQRVGEASTRYLYSRDAPRLIADEVGDARIVAILRNPVDFIASLHAHKLAGGTEDLESLEAALDAEDDRHAGRRIPADSNPHLATYRDRARFGEQLPRWIDTFGRDRVHVMVFEETVADPAPHFRRLLEFLGVDPDYRPDTFAAHNVAHGARGGLLRKLARTRAVQFVAWRVLPAVIGDARTRALSRRVGHSKLRRRATARAEVPAALRQRLEAELRPDVDRLSALLGRDLGALWFGPGAVAAAVSEPLEPVTVS